MRATIVTMLVGLVAASVAQAGQAVPYRVGDETFEGYHAAPPGPSKGLVLILHDWDGLTDYEMGRAEMLATMGYDAFAVDLYGAGNRPVDTGAKKAATAALYEDRERMRALILAGLAEARERRPGDAVVMGYCFGGAAALELARSDAAEGITGIATFHGGLSTPEGQSYGAATPPLLIAHGAADQSITMDDVAQLSRELEAAGATYEIQVYSGAPHAFTVIGSERYQQRADRHSWDAFSDFLAEHLPGG